MRNILIAAVFLCLVGLALSWEYRGDQWRKLLWVFRGLSMAVALLGLVGFFVSYPHGLELGTCLAAIGVNLPLASLGLKKNAKSK